MKMLRIFIMVAAALLAAACGGERQLPSVVGIEVVSTEWPMPSGVAAADTGDSSAAWPSGVTVRLTIDNPAGSVVLRLRVARNASALSLRAAIERRDAAAISLDWELAVRRGAWRGRVSEGPATLEQIFRPEDMERLWNVLDRVSGADTERINK